MFSDAKRSSLLVCGALVLLVLVLYAHAFECGFVNLDDTSHVTENAMVLGGLRRESVKSAFTGPHASLWIPITWISLMVDISVFGLKPSALHGENVLLHAANAVLLFLLLKRATQRFWPSAAVALIFAIHPINVESVAWITERKNVLCMFFGLLSLHAYTSWALRASKAAYATALACFALALLAKPMIVPLPAGLLLLDVWPFRRLDWTNWGKRALEKLPFLLLTIASCVMTIQATATVSSTVSFEHLPLDIRISNAVISYATYLWQLVWPKDLCVLYPHKRQVELLKAVVSFAALAAITFAAWRYRRRHPYLLTGWLWFLGMLVPTIGLVQVGPQARADRFIYIAQLGLLVAVVWLIADLWGNRPRRLMAYAASVAGAGLMLTTLHQVETWTNSVTLFEHAIAVTDPKYRQYDHAALARARIGDLPTAIDYYKKSLQLFPRRAESWNNLSAALIEVGRYADAVFSARKAIALQPDYPAARFNLAAACEAIGQDQEALAEYRRALEQAPAMASAHYRLGLLLTKQGEIGAAKESLTKAARLWPQNTEIETALQKLSGAGAQ